MSPEKQWKFIETQATDLGVNAETLRKWRKRGVAHRYRVDLVQRAAAAGFVLSRDVMDRPPVCCEAA